LIHRPLPPPPTIPIPPDPIPGSFDPSLRRTGMPISTIASYLSTMQQVIDHWTAVNTAISPTVLTLSGGYTVANFTTARTAIATAITAIETPDNARQMAATDEDIKRANLRARI